MSIDRLCTPFLAGLGLHSDGHGRLPETLFAGLVFTRRACVAELWTQYGNLTEIWLDGGFSPAIQSALQSTFKTYQPRVVAMNGGGASPNAVRWVGTEGDMGAAWGEGIWSTYCCNGTGPCVVAHTNPCSLNSGPYGGGGCAPTGKAADAMCNSWQPAGLDYTLQQGDTWFWVEGTKLRPLSELITVCTPQDIALLSPVRSVSGRSQR